ncbi:fumarylacetoacetate hydrolase family protein [Photobacterium indicum]|jgi:2-keto-4-pentenoate hydratase/2-oxohepta-3-ene-1,7-dioic acid hydratase in catechol pathway|uniref:2-keto-4-pentenoate hydratase n=1 Tax=Photobacterium indicum TaxID=81447 RepID=A0A2T3L5X0_9GAMM|nr:fumarylacetoacetate hydrolase family protein [Photobacterium indicum]PSV45293.1 2-keto-4-pentenoate hydratase [Photobacterium indicum]
MNQITLDGSSITPNKVVCVGRNYVEHIHELGNEVPNEMVLFVKPNSAISSSLLASHNGDELHYEGEISFLYQNGKFSAVAFGIDLTKRSIQNVLKSKSLPWERSKAFNGSAVFSEFVSLQPEASLLGLTLSINNTLIQEGDTQLMLYKPDEILAEIQTFMALTNGDIVMTGTPKGVGKIIAGDVYIGTVTQNGKTLVSQQWTASV